jgi:hypothetical protein
MNKEAYSTYSAEKTTAPAIPQCAPKTSLTHVKKVLARCDSYSRLPTLLEYSWLLDEDEWLLLLGEIWTICDNITEYLDDLMESPFGRSKGLISEMMNEKDQSIYDALPDIITIYRGCYKNNKWGFCWSLDPEIAVRFPLFLRYQQSGEKPILVTATVPKANIKAIKTDREESEVIAIRPKHKSTHRIFFQKPQKTMTNEHH